MMGHLHKRTIKHSYITTLNRLEIKADTSLLGQELCYVYMYSL